MMILELFVMFDTAKVEIKKEHQLLMVNNTTSFKKKGKGKKGSFKKNDKQVATPVEVLCRPPREGLRCLVDEDGPYGLLA